MENKDIDITPEKELLEMTVDLFNRFTKLSPQHPHEAQEFTRSIHELQYIIGMRILRKEHPDMFPIIPVTYLEEWI